jgi:hypothetical protein
MSARQQQARLSVWWSLSLSLSPFLSLSLSLCLSLSLSGGLYLIPRPLSGLTAPYRLKRAIVVKTSVKEIQPIP